MSTAMKKTPSLVLADKRLEVERGAKWPLMVSILPRVRAQHKPHPCDFCSTPQMKTRDGWACPACGREERTR